MRSRRNDTFIHKYRGQEKNAARDWRRLYAGPDVPSLYPKQDDIVDEVSFSMDVARFESCPGVKEALAMSANDPLSTVLHYNVSIKISLALVLGLRCCLHCPSCSQERAFDYWTVNKVNEQEKLCGMKPCQNKFGRNGRIFGGTHSLADGLTGATEHQANDTPHFHGMGSLATPYREKTLYDIQQLIMEKTVSVDSIKRFVEHMWRAVNTWSAERHVSP